MFSIKHHAPSAGEVRNCPSCGGAYIEPTDPKPGELPKKVEEDSLINLNAAAQRVEKQKVTPPVLAPKRKSESDDQVEKSEGSAGKKAIPPRFRPNVPSSKVMLEPLSQNGMQGVLIRWISKDESSVRVGHSSNCEKSEADSVIIKVALKLIKAKSPRLYRKILKSLEEIGLD